MLGMESFPTVKDLAAASEEEVNSHWAGLGFYRRARLLHKGAQYVTQKLDGSIPQTVEELKKIDGIGPYTACAIASIAFDVCVPVVDGNVCRVLSRLRAIANHIKSPALKDKEGWDLAEQLVQAGDGTQAGLVNQALMELGATYCAPSGSGVDPEDPLRSHYWSTKLGVAYFAASNDPPSNGNNRNKRKSLEKDEPNGVCELCGPTGVETILSKLNEASDDVDRENEKDFAARCGHGVFPLDPPKKAKREEDLAVAVLCHRVEDEDWWLLVRRPSDGLLAGQWEFPSVCMETRNGASTKKSSVNKNRPNKQRRKQALSRYLKAIFADDADAEISGGKFSHPDHFSCRELLEESPIQHIFSHVLWQQWVETSYTSGNTIETIEWTASDGREVRWMRQQEMNKVGITSGVKKILGAVRDNQKPATKIARASKRTKL